MRWFSQNPRFRIYEAKTGVEILNICSKTISLKNNGNGFSRQIQPGRKKVIKFGQDILIEGRLFTVVQV